MGVPNLWKWLVKHFKAHSIQKEIGEETGALYVNLNAVVAAAADQLNGDASDEQFADEVLAQLNRIIERIRPTQSLFVATDGVGPIVKLYKERARLWVQRQDKPENAWQDAAKPGTALSKTLDARVQTLLAENSWGCPTVLFSPSTAVGEADAKIAQHLRKAQPSQAAVFCDDKDMILWALASGVENVEVASWVKGVLQAISIPALRGGIAKKYGGKLSAQGAADDFVLMMAMCGNHYIPALAPVDNQFPSLKKHLLPGYAKMAADGRGLMQRNGRIDWISVSQLLKDFKPEERGCLEAMCKKMLKFNTGQLQKDRAGWDAGSRVRIFSKTNDQWYEGAVRKADGDTLTVDYQPDEEGEMIAKDLDRNDAALDNSANSSSRKERVRVLMKRSQDDHIDALSSPNQNDYIDCYYYVRVNGASERIIEDMCIAYGQTLQWLMSYYHSGLCPAWEYVSPFPYFSPLASDFAGFIADARCADRLRERLPAGAPPTAGSRLFFLLPPTSREFVPEAYRELGDPGCFPPNPGYDAHLAVVVQQTTPQLGEINAADFGDVARELGDRDTGEAEGFVLLKEGAGDFQATTLARLDGKAGGACAEPHTREKLEATAPFKLKKILKSLDPSKVRPGLKRATMIDLILEAQSGGDSGSDSVPSSPAPATEPAKASLPSSPGLPSGPTKASKSAFHDETDDNTKEDAPPKKEDAFGGWGGNVKAQKSAPKKSAWGAAPAKAKKKGGPAKAKKKGGWSDDEESDDDTFAAPASTGKQTFEGRAKGRAELEAMKMPVLRKYANEIGVNLVKVGAGKVMISNWIQQVLDFQDGNGQPKTLAGWEAEAAAKAQREQEEKERAEKQRVAAVAKAAAAAYKKGDYVKAIWPSDGQQYPGEVKEVGKAHREGLYLVTYAGFTEDDDQWLNPDQMQKSKGKRKKKKVADEWAYEEQFDRQMDKYYKDSY